MEQSITFTLEGKELASAKDWEQQHRKDHECASLSAGEQFTYRFTPGGMGTAVFVACVRCGMEQDVTDDERW